MVLYSLASAFSGLMFLWLGRLWASNRNRAIRLGFASFVMTWGIPPVLSLVNGFITDQATRLFVEHTSLLFGILQPATLFYFVSLYPQGKRETEENKAAFNLFVVSGIWAVIAMFLYATAPALVVGTGEGRAWGPLAPYLIHLPRFIGLSGALLILSRLSLSNHKDSIGKEHLSLVLGLWFLISYLVVNDLAMAGYDGHALLPRVGNDGIAVMAYGGILFISAALLIPTAWMCISEAVRSKRPLVVLLLLLPIVWGVLAGEMLRVNPSLADATLGSSMIDVLLSVVLSPAFLSILAVVLMWGYVAPTREPPPDPTPRQTGYRPTPMIMTPMFMTAALLLLVMPPDMRLQPYAAGLALASALNTILCFLIPLELPRLRVF